MKKHIFLFLITSLFYSNLKSQELIPFFNEFTDSIQNEKLIEVCIKIEKADSLTNNEKTKSYNNLFEFAKKHNCKLGESNVLMTLFDHLSYSGKLDTSLLVYENLKNNYWSIINQESRNYLNIMYGGNLDLLQKNDLALAKFYKNIKECNDSNYLISNYQGISSIYFKLRKIDLAIKYSKKALTIFLNSKNKNDLKLALIYQNLGRMYKRLPDIDSSIHYFEKSYNKKENPSALKALIYIHLKGENYDISKVKKYSVKLEKLVNTNYKWYDYKTDIQFIKAQMYILNQQYDSSYKYSQLALEASKKTDNIAYVNHAYLAYVKALLKDKYHFVDSVIKYQEIINNKQVTKNTVDAETKYRTLEKEKDLLYQKNKNLNFKTIIQYFAIALLLLTIILFRQFWKNKHNIQKKEHEIASQINRLNNSAKIIEELNQKLNKNDNLNVVVNSLKKTYINDEEWDEIKIKYETIHTNHIQDLKKKNPKITNNDIKLSILMGLNYSDESMIDILKISKEGVKKAKYRLKKKLNS